MKRIITSVLLCLLFWTVNAQTDKIQSYCTCDTVSIIKDTSDFSLVIYRPVCASLALVAHRPDSTDKRIVLSVPSAFTAKNYTDVVGKFVAQDTVINNPTEQETGYCVITEDKMLIKPLEDSSEYYSEYAVDNKGNYFQQMLLLYHGNKTACTVFGKQKPTFRRALCLKDGLPCVAESLNRMNIDDFTDVLAETGFTDAIYLDMGTWSEGFYKDIKANNMIIGKLRQNTSSQTNWLIFLGSADGDKF